MINKKNIFKIFRQNPSSDQDFFSEKGWGDISLWFFNAILAALTAILIFKSRNWTIFYDSSIYHYIAWLMSRGAVPYKDIFDQNFPGTFYLHLFIIKLLGSSDFAFRLFDLLWLGITTIFIFAYCKTFGTLPAVSASVLFSCFHLVSGMLCMGQRDYFMVVFLIAGAHYTAGSIESNMSLRKIFIAGLCLGAAAMIKPYPGAFCLILLPVIGIYGRKTERSLPFPIIWFFLGNIIVPSIICFWLFIKGGFFPFIDIIFNYLIPIYSKLSRISIIKASFNLNLFCLPLIVIAAAVITLSGLALIVLKHFDVRRGILLLGALYGIVHYFIQGRGWYYHVYPLMAFVLLLAASWTSMLKLKKTPILYCNMMFIIIVLKFCFAAESIKHIIKPPHFSLDATHLLVRDLQNNIIMGDKIQSIDYSGLSPFAFLLLQYPTTSRFILTFHIFHNIHEPYIQKLRAEYLRELRESKPKLIIVHRASWDISNFEYLKTFPELDEWINNRYEVLIERHFYRIYKIKSQFNN